MIKTLPVFACALLLSTSVGCARSSSDEDIAASEGAVSAEGPYDCTLQLVEEVPVKHLTVKITPGHEDVCFDDPNRADGEITKSVEFNAAPAGAHTRCNSSSETGPDGNGEGTSLTVFDSTTLEKKFQLTLECDPSIPAACLSPLPGLQGRLGVVTANSADTSEKDLDFNQIDGIVVARLDKAAKTVNLTLGGNRTTVDFEAKEGEQGMTQEGTANALFSTTAPKIELDVKYAGRTIHGSTLTQNVRLTCSR
jgi:hypothetical protein